MLHNMVTTPTVLMIAEKPSIATAIAAALSSLSSVSLPTSSTKSPPCYDFRGTFNDRPAYLRISSVHGHVFSTDFPPQYQNWDAVEPLSLFQAPIISTPTSDMIVRHLNTISKGVDILVLWLDCDREGENICFEVIRCVEKNMSYSKCYGQRIYRAKFSAVTTKDIEKALNSLTIPNENESKAVDARQELDLKIGVAFSRFQTSYFRGKYDIDSSVVSFGPCQTPTLGFCVQRHDDIQSFVSEAYWTIALSVSVDNKVIELQYSRLRIFNQSVTEMFASIISKDKLKCIVSKSSETKRTRPKPLNTVELLKLASRNLGIGPYSAMKAAEFLYLSGYMSYPRTESTTYPKSFDIKEALTTQTRNSEYGSYAKELLSKGYNNALHGHDAGDHPPITPVGVAYNLSGDNLKIYNLVVRQFLASISNDATFMTTKLIFQSLACDETFSVTKSIQIDAGFLAIYDRSRRDVHRDGDGDGDDDRQGGGVNYADTLPEVSVGDVVSISFVSVKQGKTASPGYLTEAELIGLMEKHGIGTDASIPTHINNILARNYVTLGPGRTLVPSTLGTVLVHGYKSIDPDLVLPLIRGSIEKYCDQIAKGVATKDTVISHSLNIFVSKFIYFTSNIAVMDNIFEASFSPLAATGKFLSKCGVCLRFMRYIHVKPQRLYCPVCDVNYSLPQNGTIKLYKELKCPLDSFELVLFSLGNSAASQGKSYPLCPYCYNYPPSFEVEQSSEKSEGSSTVTTVSKSTRYMGCNSCKHPTCKNSGTNLQICPCPGNSASSGDMTSCDGMLVLDTNSKPNWKFACNVCNTLLRFRADIHDIKPSVKLTCSQCDLRLLKFEFNLLKTPLKDGSTSYIGCLICDDFLNSLTEIVIGRSTNIKIVHQMRHQRGVSSRGRR